MLPYRHAVYWFAVVLAIDVAGFWPTYFSRLAEAAPAHHAHAISMLAWMLLLITQHQLIHHRCRGPHRILGRASLALAPAVVITAVWVNLHFLARKEAPYPEGLLGVYWFGYFLGISFGILYSLAILNRRRVQHHARYMAATALVFLIPGLSRAIHFYVEPVIGYVPSLLEMSGFVTLIAAWLLYQDFRRGQDLQPNAVVLALWVGNLLAYWLLPKTAWWKQFSLWSGAWLAGSP